MSRSLTIKHHSQPLPSQLVYPTLPVSRRETLRDIVVHGARVHNLKNIHVRIPKQQITVITGLSGSGKSSLAFDTIYAEGQRRYVESLSSYARQLFGTLAKPDVDLIEGLTPAISIDQKSAAQTPRSTVGTMSEIYDYLRLLFARVGTPHCPICRSVLALKESTIVARPNKIVKHSPKHAQRRALVCGRCDTESDELTLSSFSFNSPVGACPDCHGLGTRWVLDPELILPNPRLTLAEGAVRPWSRLGNQGNTIVKTLRALRAVTGIATDVPVGDLSPSQRETVLYGTGDRTFEGVIPLLERRYHETASTYVRGELERYMVERICQTCHGQRLRPEALAVTVAGKRITDVTELTVEQGLEFFEGLIETLDPTTHVLAQPIVRDVAARLRYLRKVGLQYLTLDRGADTLAGGEAQRIRLATQLGSGLTGVLYVLDEPSIGLHPRDFQTLIETILELRDLGNTVIVVEHDQQMIEAADYLIDIGPGAGIDGGYVVGHGPTADFLKQSTSLTAQYLRGEQQISIPKRRRVGTDRHLILTGATAFNLASVTARIPLGTLTCVTGVSGSGKSTLVRDTLARALAKQYHRAKAQPGAYATLTGLEWIDKVISVDQSPIGRTPRSNPATYTNVFGPIRDLFVNTTLAQHRQYTAGHFSFNVRGGRCEACRGDGQITHEMHFLPDVYVTCETCHGTRYNQVVLDVMVQGKTIADVLAMSITEASEIFANYPLIASKLDVLVAVGLGYLELGQSATTLSGGEAQRIKLATELARQSTGSTFYILDEPTTGLHFDDVKHLLTVLQALVDKGNTVLVIEHNLDVIKSADWVIDMGPDGGSGGGQIVAEGTPEAVARVKDSATGQYLSRLLRAKH
ncbi:excinuclease ABC subunit UvrA [Candidatus Berkelbacteria bacterium]|nr:excinuclease ABC subunit UvrA [Candidatus Berkelbacteria bacterium]